MHKRIMCENSGKWIELLKFRIWLTAYDTISLPVIIHLWFCDPIIKPVFNLLKHTGKYWDCGRCNPNDNIDAVYTIVCIL